MQGCRIAGSSLMVPSSVGPHDGRCLANLTPHIAWKGRLWLHTGQCAGGRMCVGCDHKPWSCVPLHPCGSCTQCNHRHTLQAACVVFLVVIGIIRIDLMYRGSVSGSLFKCVPIEFTLARVACSTCYLIWADPNKSLLLFAEMCGWERECHHTAWSCVPVKYRQVLHGRSDVL